MMYKILACAGAVLFLIPSLLMLYGGVMSYVDPDGGAQVIDEFDATASFGVAGVAIASVIIWSAIKTPVLQKSLFTIMIASGLGIIMLQLVATVIADSVVYASMNYPISGWEGYVFESFNQRTLLIIAVLGNSMMPAVLVVMSGLLALREYRKRTRLTS